MKKLIALILIWPLALLAVSPSYTSFDGTQFVTNGPGTPISAKNGFPVTNINVAGSMTTPGLFDNGVGNVFLTETMLIANPSKIYYGLSAVTNGYALADLFDVTNAVTRGVGTLTNIVVWSTNYTRPAITVNTTNLNANGGVIPLRFANSNLDGTTIDFNFVAVHEGGYDDNVFRFGINMGGSGVAVSGKNGIGIGMESLFQGNSEFHCPSFYDNNGTEFRGMSWLISTNAPRTSSQVLFGASTYHFFFDLPQTNGEYATFSGNQVSFGTTNLVRLNNPGIDIENGNADQIIQFGASGFTMGIYSNSTGFVPSGMTPYDSYLNTQSNLVFGARFGGIGNGAVLNKTNFYTSFGFSTPGSNNAAMFYGSLLGGTNWGGGYVTNLTTTFGTNNNSAQSGNANLFGLQVYSPDEVGGYTARFMPRSTKGSLQIRNLSGSPTNTIQLMASRENVGGSNPLLMLGNQDRQGVITIVDDGRIGIGNGVDWSTKPYNPQASLDINGTARVSSTLHVTNNITTVIGQFNGNGAGLTNLPPAAITGRSYSQTNFVLNTVYAAPNGPFTTVAGTAILTAAAAVGNVELDVMYQAGGSGAYTAISAPNITTTALSIVMPYQIPFTATFTNGNYYLTNSTTTVGGSATLKSGTGTVTTY